MSKQRKPSRRNPIAGVLTNPCFKKQVVKDRKKYTRKGRAVHNNKVDGSFVYTM